jgi:hypothetical protein
MSDRKTDMKDGELVSVAVAAVKVEAGHLGALNASGYLAPAADTANFTVIGRIEETVDNSGGSAGDLTCLVRRLKAFKFANSATAAVAQAHVGKNCLVEDSVTVSSDTTNDIVAGKVLSVETDGVWIYVG